MQWSTFQTLLKDLHTVHANFSYDISTMDLHKKTQNNTRMIRVHLLYNILRHGLLSRPR
jgi:hypothetical protein